MEVDNELLYGSTLEITYEIFVTNESETNYLTKAYYKYGTEREIICGSPSQKKGGNQL